jgi:CBS domain-containing protein
MKISDLLRTKAASSLAEVVTIEPDRTITEVLAKLAEHHIGALVVADGDGLIGIVSERDIVRRLNERGADLLGTPVREIMTSSVLSCRPGDDVDRIAETMTERRIRHLPVLEGEQLVGLVSIGDVVKSRIRELEVDRGQLEHYITG